VTLVIETSSLTDDRRTKFVETLDPTLVMSEIASDDPDTTTFAIARRDARDLTMKERRDATLAAFGAGFTVLRAGLE
jgi:hypothetical protein